MTDSQTITENDETFTRGFYNGLSILIRDKDNYVNAGRLCKDGGKDLYELRRGKRWENIVEFWKNHQTGNLRSAIYELKTGYNECKGLYVHKDLIHFVAEYVSIEYAFKVKYIMDAINENNFEKLNIEIIDLKTQNYGLTVQTQNLKHNCNEKGKELYDKSIRSDDCNKKLKIMKNNNIFVVSACQDKVAGKLFKEYIFPSAIAIRQLIRKNFKKEGQAPKFKEEELPQLIEFIEELKPKITN
jgi:hypothetical protein